jgi:hypothetical protein
LRPRHADVADADVADIYRRRPTSLVTAFPSRATTPRAMGSHHGDVHPRPPPPPFGGTPLLTPVHVLT